MRIFPFCLVLCGDADTVKGDAFGRRMTPRARRCGFGRPGGFNAVTFPFAHDAAPMDERHRGIRRFACLAFAAWFLPIAM